MLTLIDWYNLTQQERYEKWKGFTHKEKNYFLGLLGGCEKCSHWESHINELGLEFGCLLNKIPNESHIQVYDNGYIQHSKLL